MPSLARCDCFAWSQTPALKIASGIAYDGKQSIHQKKRFLLPGTCYLNRARMKMQLRHWLCPENFTILSGLSRKGFVRLAVSRLENRKGESAMDHVETYQARPERSIQRPGEDAFTNRINFVDIMNSADKSKDRPATESGQNSGLPQLELYTSGALDSSKDIIMNGNNNTINGNDNSTTINQESAPKK